MTKLNLINSGLLAINGMLELLQQDPDLRIAALCFMVAYLFLDRTKKTGADY